MVVKKSILFVVLMFCALFINAQNILLDDIGLMDHQRNAQLLNDSIHFTNNSFLIRSTSHLQYLQDTKKSSNKFRIRSLSFSYDQQNNSLLPESWNDGIIYPARGWQERYSVGANIRWGILDINVQPEWLKVQNIPQEPYYGNPNDGNWGAKYFGYVANNISNFRQFGNTKIDTTTLGQSRIGISTKYFAAGVSNENIWWGPGKRNSVVFTNNAGGFKHMYLHTNEPIPTPIGNVELATIIGVLDTTRYTDPDVGLLSGWKDGIALKNPSKRNINGITLNWNPKWIPGFYLGYAYSRQYYNDQVNYAGEPLHFFSKDLVKTEIGSFMFRFALPKDHAEFYGEMGLPNQAAWPWKFFQSNPKTAFVFGGSKQFLFNKGKSYLNLNVEFAQFQIMDPRNIYYLGAPWVGGPPNSWYVNPTIKQGYSNNGQIMGASIGPGSNSQSIDFSWNRGYNKIGFSAERIIHNNDFYYLVYLKPYDAQYGYYNRYWVDVNTSVYAQIMPIKNIIIAASIMNTNALNYMWVRYEDGHVYDEPSKLSDKFNSQIKLSVKYLLHAVVK